MHTDRISDTVNEVVTDFSEAADNFKDFFEFETQRSALGNIFKPYKCFILLYAPWFYSAELEKKTLKMMSNLIYELKIVTAQINENETNDHYLAI